MPNAYDLKFLDASGRQLQAGQVICESDARAVLNAIKLMRRAEDCASAKILHRGRVVRHVDRRDV